MTGWLIYPKPEAEKNSWFIKNLIDYASKCDIDLKLKYAQDIAFGISENNFEVNGGFPQFVRRKFEFYHSFSCILGQARVR